MIALNDYVNMLPVVLCGSNYKAITKNSSQFQLPLDSSVISPREMNYNTYKLLSYHKCDNTTVYI